MENNFGLIHAFVFDGTGGAKPVDWPAIKQWQPEQGILWVHMDYTSDYARNWITEDSAIDTIIADALLTEETRPRTTFIRDSALLALRGINLNPGSEPEDMVSIRIWVQKDRIISTRKRKLLSISDIVASFSDHEGPSTSGQFIADLVSRLTTRMENVIVELEDRVSQLEEDVIVAGNHALRGELSAVRRETIMLRRYLAPQREAMTKLYSEKVSWLSEDDRIRLREATDQLIRHIEDLDTIRDRASVIQEELVNKLTEQMNSRMYVLSLVAAVFLPIGFLTGLLGVNVGGIPLTDDKSGFMIIVVLISLFTGLQIFFFKKKGWF